MWRRHVALVALMVAAMAIAAVGVVSARIPDAAARAALLVQAQQRWAVRRLVHYRLVMQAPSWCRMDAEIENERVVRVYENSCPGSANTVTDLFDLARRLDRNPDTIYCAAGGCECLEQRFVYVEYDRDLGFPRAIRARRQRTANWDGLLSYVLARGVPNCLPPRDTDVVRVLSLDPLS